MGKVFKELLQSSIKMKWGSLLVLFLLILSACNTIKTEPGPTEIPKEPVIITETVDLCEGVECDAGKSCVNGACACPSDKKACGEECIAKEACCTDAECDGRCYDNECVSDSCDYGKVFQNGKCVCADGFKECKDQEKCIPENSCCNLLGCRSFEDCVPTSFATRICMKNEEKTMCRMINDMLRVEYFNINDHEFRVEPQQFRQNSTQLLIGNETVILQPDAKIDREGVEIWQEDFKVMGGFCREEED